MLQYIYLICLNTIGANTIIFIYNLCEHTQKQPLRPGANKTPLGTMRWRNRFTRNLQRSDAKTWRCRGLRLGRATASGHTLGDHLPGYRMVQECYHQSFSLNGFKWFIMITHNEWDKGVKMVELVSLVGSWFRTVWNSNWNSNSQRLLVLCHQQSDLGPASVDQTSIPCVFRVGFLFRFHILLVHRWKLIAG